MCHQHCLAAGGCKCPGHQELDDEDVPPALRPRAKLRAYEQREHKAEQASISTTPCPFTFYDDLLDDALYPLTQLHAYQQREHTAEQAMDNALGLRSPSPDISLEDALLQQEADDLTEAIHHSKLPRHKPFTGVSPDFPQSITIPCASHTPQSAAAVVTKPTGTKKKPTNPDRNLSYGSGAASGGKAKKEKSKPQVSSLQPIPRSAPAPPPPPPLLYTLHGPRPLATPPSFPPPAHPFPHPIPPLNPYQVPQHTYTQPTYPYYPYYYLCPRP
ncbi:hypothetical protein DFH07DRAFT_952160 [Mycena maculata]|uniref:Uncharacterized protein n=1 Tax=Mycena maculata TaxID=230809 RepID=A0AAD7NTN7_9AGAR|nr:hypothetical protein DFH07DRAFT_952160 [Mycena maculata]